MGNVNITLKATKLMRALDHLGEGDALPRVGGTQMCKGKAGSYSERDRRVEELWVEEL